MGRLRSVLLLLASLSACGRSTPQPGEWIHCTCPYLTDYDDRAMHQVQVCTPNRQAAPKLAAECASRHQPGHFDPCQCGESKGPCDGTQACHSLENQ
ncbi:MAG: hypothetical protein HY898_21505 [Deltaproteobacteria bacterium]|nr:hypothetical protein [Deltaproteobacteria bacterium]